MRAVELFVNLWIFGVPVALLVWAVLRLAVHVPARLRYAIAVAGFVATLATPVILSRPAATLRTGYDGEGSPSDGAASVFARGSFAVSAAQDDSVRLAWLAVATLLLLRDVVGHARLRRVRLYLPEAPEALKRALDWPASVPLAVTEHASPFTAGLLKPTVVLPRDLAERFPLDVVQRIARHELSHARWRDPLVYAALRVVAALFWVAPAWIVLRWVRREREAAADAAALRDSSGAEESYVAALVRLSRPSRELAPAMAASDLRYRARRILARQGVSVVAVLALLLGAALFAVAEPARFDSGEPVVVRTRSVAVTQPAPRVEVKTVPSKEPRRAKPKRTRRTVESPPPEPPAAESVTVQEHVDVMRHVHVVRHVVRD